KQGRAGERQERAVARAGDRATARRADAQVRISKPPGISNVPTDTMKNAEALLLRAHNQTNLASLQARAQKHTIVQEGERPAEDPKVILGQIEIVATELQRLVFAINRTNLTHVIRTGEALTEALAKRDALVLRHRVLQSVVEVCAKPPERYGVKEI